MGSLHAWIGAGGLAGTFARWADAEECLAAKQQLVDATTAEQADLAARKIKLLCDD